MAHEIEKKALARYLEENHLKRTRQRNAILEVFLEAPGHVTSDELYQNIRGENPSIGYATVYRTMKLLCDAGLAQARHFDDGVTRYEVAFEHHDHLLCIKCGKIVEFESRVVEAAQERIAAEHGFSLLRHRHELYGHCADCRED